MLDLVRTRLDGVINFLCVRVPVPCLSTSLDASLLRWLQVLCDCRVGRYGRDRGWMLREEPRGESQFWG